MKLLRSEQISWLFEFLQQHTHSSLEEIKSQFLQQYPSQEWSTLALGLYLLLQDQFFPQAIQQCIIFWIFQFLPNSKMLLFQQFVTINRVYEEWMERLKQFPQVMPPSYLQFHIQLKYLLLLLLHNQGQTLSSLSPQQFIYDFDPVNQFMLLLRQSMPLLQQLQQQYELERKLYSIGTITEQCMSPIQLLKQLPLEQVQHMPGVTRLIEKFSKNLEEIPKEIPDRVYTAELKLLEEIEFVPRDKLLPISDNSSSIPPINPIASTNGNANPSPQENSSSHQERNFVSILSSEQFQKLFFKALKQQLQPTQELAPLLKHLEVIDASHPDASIILHFQPQLLTELVNVNPKLACEFLIKLDSLKEYLEYPIEQYFSVLATMSTSLGPMETINLISVKQKQLKKVVLPKQYVLDYIVNSLSSIEKMSNNFEDNSSIQRQVRLFCVFFQSLLRNEVITKPNYPDDPEEVLLLQVKQFAFHYTKLKEAQQLYSQLGML